MGQRDTWVACDHQTRVQLQRRVFHPVFSSKFIYCNDYSILQSGSLQIVTLQLYNHITSTVNWVELGAGPLTTPQPSTTSITLKLSSSNIQIFWSSRNIRSKMSIWKWFSIRKQSARRHSRAENMCQRWEEAIVPLLWEQNNLILFVCHPKVNIIWCHSVSRSHKRSFISIVHCEYKQQRPLASTSNHHWLRWISLSHQLHFTLHNEQHACTPGEYFAHHFSSPHSSFTKSSPNNVASIHCTRKKKHTHTRRVVCCYAFFCTFEQITERRRKKSGVVDEMMKKK